MPVPLGRWIILLLLVASPARAQDERVFWVRVQDRRGGFGQWELEIPDGPLDWSRTLLPAALTPRASEVQVVWARPDPAQLHGAEQGEGHAQFLDPSVSLVAVEPEMVGRGGELRLVLSGDPLVESLPITVAGSPVDALRESPTVYVVPGAALPRAGPVELPWSHDSSTEPAPWVFPVHEARLAFPDGFTALPGPATVCDDLAVAGETRRFAFAGGAGEVIRIVVQRRTRESAASSPTWPGLSMRLVGPDGQVIASRDEVNLRWVHRVRLTTFGAYVIEVSAPVVSDPVAFVVHCEREEAPAEPPPAPVVLDVRPQVLRPGDPFVIRGGFFPPDAWVTVAGVTAPSRWLASDRMEARAPYGATHGPVCVHSRYGVSVVGEHLRMHAAVAMELSGAPTAMLRVGDGALGITGPRNEHRIDLEAGTELAVAAYPLDASLGAFLPDPILTLDLEAPDRQHRVTIDPGAPWGQPVAGLPPAPRMIVRNSGVHTLRVRTPNGRAVHYALLTWDLRPGRRPLRPLEIPLHIRVMVDPISGIPAVSEATIRSQILGAEAWATAGVHPRVVTIEQVLAPAETFRLGSASALQAFVDRCPPSPVGLDVFVFGGLPRGFGGHETLGLTVGATGQIFLNGPALPLPGAAEPPWTLAHELGHALAGLPDLGRAAPSNLMHGDLATQRGTALTLDQINAVRFPVGGVRPSRTQALLRLDGPLKK